MNIKICEESKRFDIIYGKFNQMYHNISVKLGIPDTVFWLLRKLCEMEMEYTQNNLAELCGIPKQTINSAVATYIEKGYFMVEKIPESKNSKKVCLTDKGREFCKENIIPIIEAENYAYSCFTEEELTIFFRVIETKLDYIKEKIGDKYQL